MKNDLEPPTLTLPLLIAYVTALSTTLNDDHAAASLTTAHQSDNTSSHAYQDKSTELLWVMEDKASLSKLMTQANKTAHNKGTEGTAITLLALAQLTTHTRYQLSCFWLPTLTEETLQPYIPLLMRYRDLYAAHLIIAVNNEVNLLNYGFIPFSILADEQVASLKPSNLTPSNIKLWQFNLYDYKQLPNWLNSDYWANPENWGKHRW